MNEVLIPFNNTPLLRIAEHCVSQTPYLHQDRILPHHVLLYVKQGCIPVIEDGIQYKVKQNQIFFLKAGLHHWGDTAIQKDTEWIYIHFYLPEPDSLSSLIDIPASYPAGKEFLPEDFSYHFQLPKLFTVNQQHSFLAALKEILSVYNAKDRFRQLKCNQLLMHLLILVYEYSPKTQTSGNQDMLTYKLMDFLSKNQSRPLTSEEIKAFMEMNYRYLCEVFRRKTGLSIQTYHTKLRITEGCRLLRESTMNISQIANTVGYQDPLYFSTLFRRIIGTSPREYRKQMRWNV